MKTFATTAMISVVCMHVFAASAFGRQFSALSQSKAPAAAFAQLPERLKNAPTGSQFMTAIGKLNNAQRERAIVLEVLSGNFPSFLRDLKPVSFKSNDASGKIIRLTAFVMPDYLAVGSDRDFVRVPLNLISAHLINDAFDTMLPTRKIVNEIYQQAEVKLSPRPMKPGARMTSTGYYLNHNRTIQGQLGKYSDTQTKLVAGHKKDVVQTNKLLRKPRAIAIFGWHRLKSQRPIQPLSTVHGARYADYSHGIRLISNWGYKEVDGESILVRLPDLLKDKKDWKLLSDEGRIKTHKISKAS